MEGIGRPARIDLSEDSYLLHSVPALTFFAQPQQPMFNSFQNPTTSTHAWIAWRKDLAGYAGSISQLDSSSCGRDRWNCPILFRNYCLNL